jgi:predicted aldo/keto reductase-like oxidoreductase
MKFHGTPEGTKKEKDRKKMERIVIGKTGLGAWRLGFGGIPLQRVSEAQAVDTVLHALDLGMDFFDTGRGYTTSERRIGLALRQTDKKVILASKGRGRTAEGIRKDLETSLREMQRDYIDLYQCHMVKDQQDYQRIISSGGALEGLQKAREEGLIGHIGVTSHSLDVIDRVLDDELFETVLVCFSFLEALAAQKIFPKALAKGVGVIAMKPFSGGVIDNARLALKYAFSQEGILVLAGVEDKNLLDENWKIFQNDYRLSAGEKKEIAEYQNRYDKMFCRRCDYCQPCSEGIPIQAVLGIRSMVKRRGSQILARGGQHLEPIEKARNCSECGECMTRCPYHLPIPDLIRENLRWVDDQMKNL